MSEPVFFATPEDFRAWLEEHHADADELLVGFWKKGSRRPSITWPESVDEALCFGWIDGVRRRIDDEGYSIRFTPRKPSSTWSAVNVARVAELVGAGRMRAAGEAAFAARTEKRSATYSYEQGDVAFTPEQEAELRRDPAAWEFFSAQPASYRKAVTWWVLSAKRAETRTRRLQVLAEHNAARRRLAQFTPPARR